MNKKPIDISKSSLLSLKAEVLRKQEEISKAKLEKTYQRILPQVKKKLIKNRGIDERNRKDEIDSEIDQDALSKSRTALEAKAKLYDQLSKGEKIENEDLFLVQFDKKLQEDPDTTITEKTFNNEIDNNVDPADEWVEYTDCLGRSRKCLRKDLPFIKSRDKELCSSLPADKIQNLDNLIEVDEFNTRLTLLREQWEKKEKELIDKKNVHYQDVLFNEARSHGVGYYNFSQDDQERAKQQSELKNLREETKTKQTDIQKLKEQREKQIAARMKAARNRKRARMGLPPEEDEPEEQTETPAETNTTESEKENESKEAVEKENELNKLRSQHVRPWDIGKAGVRQIKTQEQWVKEKRDERPEEFAPPQNYRNFVRRSPETFSETDPIEADSSSLLYFTTKKSEHSHWKHYLNSSTKSLSSETISETKTRSINPYKRSQEHTSETDSDSEKQSSSSHKKSRSNERNYCYGDDSRVPEVRQQNTNSHEEILNPFTSEIVYNQTETPGVSSETTSQYYQKLTNNSKKSKNFKSTPIINEIENVNLEEENPTESEELYDPYEIDEDDHHETEKRNSQKYTEIPPPPTFEYYGPSSTRKRPNTSQQKQSISEIRSSIEAGLKFLRKQSERKHAHTEHVGYFD